MLFTLTYIILSIIKTHLKIIYFRLFLKVNSTSNMVLDFDPKINSCMLYRLSQPTRLPLHMPREEGEPLLLTASQVKIPKCLYSQEDLL